MKKFIYATAVTFLMATIVIANTGFVDSLRTCSQYSESGVVETEGMKVQSTKQIIGWEGNKCTYKESVNFSGLSSTTVCKFSKPQLNEIASVMQAYEVVQKYSNESIDTSSLSSVQNNPVVKVWQKYIQDSSVCTISSIK